MALFVFFKKPENLPDALGPVAESGVYEPGDSFSAQKDRKEEARRRGEDAREVHGIREKLSVPVITNDREAKHALEEIMSLKDACVKDVKLCSTLERMIQDGIGDPRMIVFYACKGVAQGLELDNMQRNVSKLPALEFLARIRGDKKMTNLMIGISQAKFNQAFWPNILEDPHVTTRINASIVAGELDSIYFQKMALGASVENIQQYLSTIENQSHRQIIIENLYSGVVDFLNLNSSEDRSGQCLKAIEVFLMLEKIIKIERPAEQISNHQPSITPTKYPKATVGELRGKLWSSLTILDGKVALFLRKGGDFKKVKSYVGKRYGIDLETEEDLRNQIGIIFQYAGLVARGILRKPGWSAFTKEWK